MREKAYRQEQEERVKGLRDFYQILGTVTPFRHPAGMPVTKEDVADSACDTAIYILACQAGEGNDQIEALSKGLEDSTVDPADLRRSAARILGMIRQNTFLASR